MLTPAMVTNKQANVFVPKSVLLFCLSQDKIDVLLLFYCPVQLSYTIDSGYETLDVAMYFDSYFIVHLVIVGINLYFDIVGINLYFETLSLP